MKRGIIIHQTNMEKKISENARTKLAQQIYHENSNRMMYLH